MKKIFALVLATAMLSSTAFAADPLLVTDKGSVTDYTVANVCGMGTNPDSTIYIDPVFFHVAKGASNLGSADIGNGEFSNANFAVYKRTFKKGGNLVKSVTIDDDSNYLAIKLNDDINVLRPASNKADNLVIDELSVKAKKDVELADPELSVHRNGIYNYSAPAASKVVSFKVGYDVVPDVSVDGSPKYEIGKVTHFVAGTASYGIASATSGDLYVEGRVYDGDKIFVNISSASNKTVLKNPAYADADLRFTKLTTNGFSATQTINVLAAEDEFVYEIVDNVIVKSNLKWNDDSYAWVGKTTGNKAYVISDIELKVGEAPAAGDGTNAPTNNPETGANDVVGVAAALAVVSLVAAGAVSLKK